MQHALLETQAHYVDFPWRPGNNIQSTGMPDSIPAANVFYDVSDPTREDLHRAYIFHCLDELGDYPEVVHLLSEEYTGPLSFYEFWIDTIAEWELHSGKPVHVAVGATKDVLDALLADPVRGPLVDTIDLRYFWYRSDGQLFAPGGGQEVAGRYAGGYDVADDTSPEQLYRQVREYRDAHPDTALIHTVIASRQQSWAFLIGGGSMLIRRMEYPDQQDPSEYIAPEVSPILQPTYDFIRGELATALLETAPADVILDAPETNWCLADPGTTYLVYTLYGGTFQVDLSTVSGSFRAQWFDPRSGALSDANGGTISAGDVVQFSAPDTQDWALWLKLQ